MKSAFGGSGFGGKGEGSMEFTAAGAWFPLIKWGLIGLGVIVGLLVLFNSVFKVTRIEAGYEGVEINLAGYTGADGMGVLQPAADADHRVPNFCADGEMDAGPLGRPREQ